MLHKAEELIQTKHGFIYCNFNNNLKENTLVLLHGNSSSSSFWNPLIESKLQDYFNILTFDLPGHGRSPIPENPEETYSFTGYSDILFEIINHYNLEKYFLFGHSLGGHVILETLEKLGGCKGVLIIGTPPLAMPPQFEKAFQMSPQFLSFMQSGSDKVAMKESFKSMVPEEKGNLAELLFEDYFKTDPKARELLLVNISRGKFIDEIKVLHESGVPVYIVVAGGDQMVNPQYFTEFLQDQEVITISGSGHYAPLENPDEFMRLILDKFA